MCSANKQRSKTGEDYFSTHYPELNFLSCGTNINLCRKEGTNPLTEELLSWADIVFVMENKHLKAILELGSQYAKKVVVLSIEDKYKYYQKELIEILIQKTLKHISL